LYCT